MPAGTSVLTTCNYPSMASSLLFEETSNLPSCLADKAYVSAAEQTLAAACAASLPRSPEVVLLKHHLLHSLPSLRDAGIPLKHHSFELSAALQGPTSMCGT